MFASSHALVNLRVECPIYTTPIREFIAIQYLFKIFELQNQFLILMRKLDSRRNDVGSIFCDNTSNYFAIPYFLKFNAGLVLHPFPTNQHSTWLDLAIQFSYPYYKRNTSFPQGPPHVATLSKGEAVASPRPSSSLKEKSVLS